MPLIIPTNSISAGGYEVANSLRFDDGSSDNLTRSQTTGNRRTWTFSTWVKRCTTGSSQGLANANTTDDDRIQFHSSDVIRIYFNGSISAFLVTNRLFRDVSAWYHIVVAVDTTQATSSDRIKLYVNGVQETSFSTETYPSQNYDTFFNLSNTLHVGSSGAGEYMDGYMAEVVFIDGTQLDPTSFGEFDEDTGIWKPIDVSGLTFGTNGFYLDFENSGSLGADVSGNGNNFTVNNLTSIDQTTDTPTNNYCTMNPLIPYNTASAGNGTFSNGNNTVSYSTTYGYTFGSIGVSTGKWYWEVKTNITGSSNGTGVGFQDMDNLYNPTTDPIANIYVYGNTGNTRSPAGDGTSYGDSYTTSIIGVALDLDNGKAYFSKDGVWQNSGDPTSGATGTGSAFSFTVNGTYVPYSADDSVSTTSVSYDFNFGNPPFTISSGNSDGNGMGNFEYPPPSGYLALCTKNLATDG